MKKLSQKEFIERCKKIHNNKYDYSITNYINRRTEIKYICPKHGVIKQIAGYHLSGHGCYLCNKYKKSNTEEFIKKAKEKFGDKYDYSKVNYINNKTKIIITCFKHGDFEISPISFLKNNGCPKCSGNYGIDTEEFIKKAKEIHGNKYDYSITNYTKMHNKIKYICPKHNIVEQYAYYHIQGNGCPKCNETNGERKIRVFCENNNIKYNYQFKFKDCKDINILPFDFYLPDYNLLIEYNGEQHYHWIKKFQEDYKDFLLQKHHDWLKRKYAKEHNIKLLIIPYWEENINTLIKESIKVK